MRVQRSAQLGSTSLLIAIILCAARQCLVYADGSTELEFFEQHIRPVLVQHCYECHSAAAEEPEGGLQVDHRAGLLKGGDSGPAILPGNASASLLIEALRHESLEMPPDEKVSEEIVANFVRWIDQGALDPRDTPLSQETANELAWEAKLLERKQWWSLQPVRRPEVPNVKNREWSEQQVDRFILARLEEQGLSPAPRADRHTLIRRLTFSLTGLPPTPKEVQEFVDDESSGAWEKLVDRLLSSPHFGERFARHWMDVVRYSDTYGYEWDIPAKGAWRYRDYLIRAFNADVPFDQLIREHIAGDLIDSPRINHAEQINESLIGLMFYQMGEKRHGDSAEFNGVHQEMLDDKINTFSKAFQAITITCARCHDHKLDAVSQKEYYALAGAFFSSRWVTNTLDTPERNRVIFDDLRDTKTLLRQQLATQWLNEIDALSDSMINAQTSESPVGESPQSLWSVPPKSADLPELAWEDPRSAWFRILRGAKEETDLSPQWQEIAKQYEAERNRRIKHNAEHFTVVADFRNEIPAGWSVDGVGLQSLAECGDFIVALDGTKAIEQLLPGGLFAHSLSPRLNGAVRTPYLSQFEQAHLTVEYCGGDYSAHRTIVDNAFLTERQTYLDAPTLGWLQFSTYPQYRDRRVYLEFATKTSNPNFPPRMGLGPNLSAEEISDPRSWFGVTRVLSHDEPGEPKDELTHFAKLFAAEAPNSFLEVAALYQAWFRTAILAWLEQQASDVDIRLINWLLENGIVSNRIDLPEDVEVGKLVRRYRRLEQLVETPQTINGVADIDPGCDYRLNIRGDFDLEGEQVPRGYLEALTNSKEGFQVPGSGRLELAAAVASPDNPLTARVIVNRVWHWLFGRGIVATPNNFGKLGELPSHPELLDYLTSRFIAEGWSVKKLVRMLVLTETWRQANQTSDLALQADPDNRLLHHFSTRRLVAEAVRDSMLAISGQLEPRLYGLPVDPYRAKEDPQKRLVSGPLDGDGRRSLYTKITIMEPPSFLAVFNQPQPKIPTGRRDLSNTPLQSLSLLNDAFVTSQAGHWAVSLVATDHPSVADRLEQMFRQAYARSPSELEIDRWSQAVNDFVVLHRVAPGEELTSLAVWKDIAHAMFNTKEFIYVK